MDVPGRKRSSDAILFCQPCKGDDDTVQAEGYCEDCNEFICSSCIKAHRKLAVTKFHVIKFKGEMPSFLTARNDACTELCDYHKNEIVKFYCKEHNSVGCRDCMVLKHTSCKIQLVSDVSRKCNVSDELVYTKYRIDHLKKSLASCKEEIKCSLQTADEIKAIAIKDIKQFRKDMDTYLDNVEETLMQEVEMVNDCDVRTQKKLHDQCDEINDEIIILQSKLEQCKDNINNLFVTSKLVQEKLQKCHEINKDISSKSQIHTFKFTPSEEMNALKIDNKSIGHINKQLKKYQGKCRESITGIKAHLLQKFNIKTKQEMDCYIRSMTIISETEILCADQINRSLKVFNYAQGKITSTLETASPPADVTTINSKCAATTLLNEDKILFLDTQSGLSVSRKLKVREGCLGIDHHNGTLAVSFYDPPAIQVLDMKGHILHQVIDTTVLKYPRYVSLSNNKERMYVSDWENEAVYEFTLEGHLTKTIKNEEMGRPAGMTVTDGDYVVVCYPNKSDKVGVIEPRTREMQYIYLQDVGRPVSILIVEDKGKLFISERFDSENCSVIKMLDFKKT